ncbi:hypothetical protein [Bacillus piscicola]|uniref:hypothetical protein n=1 Tax=Bacillus piscicola TaxID=1632684 RepID=UPI001F09C75D|nr:hypothetical protein [Bacillus piscicola]
MYYPHNIEEVCYAPEHVEQVLTEIRLTFPDYFHDFIQSEAGQGLSLDDLAGLAEHFGSDGDIWKRRKKDEKETFQRIFQESIAAFEKDRDDYLELLDEEAFDEYEDDPNHFKNKILRDECPIIRVTIYSEAKELDKYKRDFNLANPAELLDVVMNLAMFANTYKESRTAEQFEAITTLEELGFEELDTEDYIVYGAIGGGIKSHLLYKQNPSFFPNRSRDALWALWYLTNKKTFGCEEDSEFLMINVKESTTQQNYFYPYELFSFYALQIFNMLDKEAEKLGVHINREYRFVLVNAFLQFVAATHSDEINFLKSQLKEVQHGL